MRELFFWDKQFSFDGGKHWISSHFYGKKLAYGKLPEDDVEKKFDDFNSAMEYLTRIDSKNPFVTQTIFGKYAIKFKWGLNDSKTMTAKHFKPFSLRWHYEPCDKVYTFKQLMEELDVNDFVDFCKDKGLTISANVV